ncbi:aldo/keto reductase [Cyclobacterium amurskyense]|uniref:Oxidoreductase of aldo/keto reductase family, subgroup 1 n=1 Tax=Cyclobacterium amurskyense TaxID=320787 RepID=A0A0H4PIB7_9BACT|nr:aldo/keto reductase [Cyclobacterium amurskyense]AKP52790.1 Oxidoreductase of aldo/keto reductase family, subgroup 1 [Cyclobacterium amurskyense]
MKYITFKNQDKMPMLGLGTWKSGPGEVYQAVLWALEAGYRHIDCAAIYQNEKEVGDALKEAFDKGIVKREEVWVTSKLWNNAHEIDKVEEGLQKTLADLQLTYLDLYLIHWPISLKSGVTFPKDGNDFLDYKTVPLTDTWKGMEALKEKGLTKHIGVSNFNKAKLSEIIGACQVVPEMNQIEIHPYLPQEGLVSFCKEKGINLTAYSPLGSADRPKARQKEDDPILMEHKVFKDIAKKHEASVAQVLIAWSLHRGIAVIPKSANKDRIKANLASKDIELDKDDLKAIGEITSRHRYIDGTFFTEVPGSPFKQSDLWES